MEGLITAYITLGNGKKKDPIMRRMLSDRNSITQYIFNYFSSLKLQFHSNIFIP